MHYAYTRYHIFFLFFKTVFISGCKKKNLILNYLVKYVNTASYSRFLSDFMIPDAPIGYFCLQCLQLSNEGNILCLIIFKFRLVMFRLLGSEIAHGIFNDEGFRVHNLITLNVFLVCMYVSKCMRVSNVCMHWWWGC